MQSHLSNVAVIGAGLGGCAVAIALSKHGIPVTVYESRAQNAEGVHSGVQLTPNGLRVLAFLGVYDRIKDRCYTSTHRTFKNDRDKTVKKVISAEATLYGYSNHRLWRSILLDAMKDLLAEEGTKIIYNARFESVVQEDEEGVSFIVNAQPHHASLLIASDGIHSNVRRYIAPDIQPYYTGTTGVLAHIPRASVAWPYDGYERNATIQGKPGAIFFVPEDPDAEVIMTGLQVQYPEQNREDLERLQNDKAKLAAFYQQGYEDHGRTARSIIDAVIANQQSCYIWPFMKMPTLDRWYSGTGRVIVIGDGAHALPPASAQGVNQALEDAYTLTLVLSSPTQSSNVSTSLPDTLGKWQSRRQQRIDAIYDWTANVANVSRLPEEERARLEAEGKLKDTRGDDMSWLYGYDAATDFKI